MFVNTNNIDDIITELTNAIDSLVF